MADHVTRIGFRRRAVVAVQVAVMSVVLIGFAALTVDLAALYNTRTDLQRTADAAALAGASSYTTDDMMRIRQGNGSGEALSLVTGEARTRVVDFVQRNLTLGVSTMSIAFDDVGTGSLDLYSASATVQAAGTPDANNAVRVMVRREAGEGGNGPIQYFFAAIFGRSHGESTASAVAVFDDRFSSFAVGDGGANLLPFTIHRDAFESELASGGDQYAWNEGGGTVESSGDGIREVRLYPYPFSGTDYSEGDGNFGVLNIGTGNQGVEAEQVQILNGVTAADMEMEIGTSTPAFQDDSGGSITYDVTGSPGMESSLKATLEPLVGQVVGFFLHDNVILSGANAIYTISDLRFGRVMAIRLTGQPDLRGFYIQPVSYAGGGVRIDPNAQSSGGLVGRIVLAR